MKVALVSRFPKDINQPRGGVETATVGLVKALSGHGAKDIHVITLERSLKSARHESHEQAEVHRLPRSNWPMMLDVFCGPSTKSLRAYLGELKPDVVHFQETWGFGSAGCGFPNVFTVHGFDSKNLPTERRWGWRVRSSLWRMAENRGLRNQAAIVSIAPYVKKEIERHTSARIYDVWNCLDRRLFEIERREKKGTVLFLGWINPRKNPLVLVEVAARLKAEFPEIRVELCGEESDPAYAEKVRDAIERFEVGDLVKLTGRISQPQVAEKIREASVLVLPSLQENAPMVIAEAMAAGLPVIASNRCGIPDMLTDGSSGYLVEPFDVEGIADRIRSLLCDDAGRNAIAARAKEEAIRRYHPTSVAEATLEIYEGVMSTHHRNRNGKR